MPVELLVGALQEAVLGQELPFGFAAKVTWTDDALVASHSATRPLASAVPIRSRSTPSRISRRGPAAGVNGTEACSFG